MKVAVVGATGLVGQVMVRMLEEFGVPVDELVPVASQSSAGKEVIFRKRGYRVVTLEEGVAARPEMALFSAGAAISREWAPRFADAGAYVIDNSSAWRKDINIPLIVPEVNPEQLKQGAMIISNPNCSTIQLVMVLFPLHKKYRIRRVVVSTYQAVTGSGARGLRQLENEREGRTPELFFPHTVDLNLIPQGGDFLPDGYTTEEEKLAFETRKIMGDDSIKVTATVVRVPVLVGHSESVNIEFERPFDAQKVGEILTSSPGIIVQDEPSRSFYPMPVYAREKNEVFVGRIRRDNTIPSGLNLWIVSDNLRKGAATNAVQIASLLIEKKFIG